MNVHGFAQLEGCSKVIGGLFAQLEGCSKCWPGRWRSVIIAETSITFSKMEATLS